MLSASLGDPVIKSWGNDVDGLASKKYNLQFNHEWQQASSFRSSDSEQMTIFTLK